MAAQGNARPIIKRKKIIQGGGHHGGAWKVAYADFVTAMMAFFLLMWLLGATTEKQRKGIADYFNPTIPVNRVSGGGEGAFGGDSVFSEQTLARNGTGAGLNRPTSENQARGNQAGLEAGQAAETGQILAKVEEALQGLTGESAVRDLLRRHVVMRVSDEGLVIELFDRDRQRLFAPGSDAAQDALFQLVPVIADALDLVVNRVAVQGHVSSSPVVMRDPRPWELSTSRADAVRGLLDKAGLEQGRVIRVTGFADRIPVAADPMAVRNNRIEIVVLRDIG